MHSVLYLLYMSDWRVVTVDMIFRKGEITEYCSVIAKNKKPNFSDENIQIQHYFVISSQKDVYS